MYRNLLFVLVSVLFFSACSHKNSVVYTPIELQHNSFDFELMKAFNYEYFGLHEKARDEFLNLFSQYNNIVFLENAYLLTLANNLNKKDELDQLIKPYLDKSDNLKRLNTLYALSSLELQRAEKMIKELLAKKDNDPRNFEIYGDILARKNDFKNAAKYYKLSYKQTQSEEILLKLISAYAILNRTEAIKENLKDFVSENGCTLKTCLLLAKIYNDERNYESLKEIYMKLYQASRDKKFINAVVEILNMQNKKEQALDLSLEYDLDVDIKLYLYQELKKFQQAKDLSLKTYNQTQDKNYLLKAAIFEFEAANEVKKITSKVIHSVREKFEQAIDKDSNALYLNYYGYLLIDYDLDVKKGLELVKLALEKDPQNLYYLDSLAWGYYKLGDCKQAWEILKQTLDDKEFANSDESKAHIKAIRACIKP